MSIFSYDFKRLPFNLAFLIKHSVRECSFIIKGLPKEWRVRWTRNSPLDYLINSEIVTLIDNKRNMHSF
jgi:hypothetical protein